MKITKPQANALISIFASYERKFEDLNKLRDIKNKLYQAKEAVKRWANNNDNPTEEDIKAEYNKIVTAIAEWRGHYDAIELPEFEEITKIIKPYEGAQQDKSDADLKPKPDKTATEKGK